MAQYNFWTSQGFIQTSTITRYNTNGSGTSAITTNFSELHKYPLPDTTVHSSYNVNYFVKLFGFVRGSDTFEYQYMLHGTSVIYATVRLIKNGAAIYNIRYDAVGSYSGDCVAPSPTHFFICQPLSCSSYDTNVTSTIYDYTANTINISGSNVSTNGKGGFCIGFCTNNVTLTNSYMNNYNPSPNNIRIILFNIIIAYTSNLTNISEYPTLLEFICGKNVKYVGDNDISTTGGGFGTFDGSSDTNTIPDTNDTTDFETSNIIMANSGLFTTHIMDNSSLQSFASALWDNSITTLLSHLLVNPLDVVISLKRLPVTLTSSTTKSIHLGITDTEINTPILTQQFVTVNCGAVHPHEFWGNSLDYSPNTKMMIYLPFIGIKNIDVDYYMSKELVVKYIIDVLSGDFVCFLQQTETNIVQNVLATFTGNCAMQYPLSMPNYEQLIGAGAAFVSKTVSGGVKGGQIGAVKGALTSVGNTIGSKPEYEKTGGYNANMGFCGIMKPYIIIERPQQSLPDKVEKYCGFPSNIVSKLSTLTGFTKIQDINLSVTATEEEKKEIETLLKKGVVI